MAKTVMDAAIRRTTSPDRILELIKEINGPKVIYHSINLPDNKFIYRFDDLTTIEWLKELGQYAISYPPLVKNVYIPISLPSYKDRIGHRTAENELAVEIAKVGNHIISDENVLLKHGCA